MFYFYLIESFRSDLEKNKKAAVDFLLNSVISVDLTVPVARKGLAKLS